MKETRISQKVVRVYTEHYMRSWGYKPRGFGLWCFESQVGGSGVQFSHGGSYSEAKRAAIRWAAKRGYHDLEVLP